MSPDIEPSQYCAAVTASDSTSLMRTINGVEYAPRSIYVGSTGTIVAKFQDGTSVTFSGVPAGAVLPIRPKFVMAASTASAIVAIY